MIKAHPLLVRITLLVMTLLVIAGRLSIPTRGFETFSWPGTYEALAHIVVGCLLALWLAGNRVSGWLFLLVTLFEIVLFLFF